MFKGDFRPGRATHSRVIFALPLAGGCPQAVQTVTSRWGTRSGGGFLDNTCTGNLFSIFRGARLSCGGAELGFPGCKGGLQQAAADRRPVLVYVRQSLFRSSEERGPPP